MNIVKNFLLARVEEHALKNWQTYKFAQEWLWLILIAVIVKLGTAAVSIFSGFFYLDNFFYGLLNSTAAAKFFSVLTLVCIEGLAAILLGKFFKFALRCRFLTAAGPLLGVLLIFSISFIVSTNGIALFTTENVDNSQTINARFNTEIENLKTEQRGEIAVIEEQINTIKNNPSEWKDGKRCVLSAAQLQHVQNLYSKIEAVKAATDSRIKQVNDLRKQELSLNDANTMSEASRFYKIVAIIMLIQFALSGVLMFFWSKITAYKAPEISEREAYKNAENDIIGMVRSGFERVINSEFTRYNTMFADIASNAQTDAQKQQPAPQIAAKTEQKKFGFVVPEPAKTTPTAPGNGDENAQENAVFAPFLQTHSDAPTAAVGGGVQTAETAEKTEVTNASEPQQFCKFCGVVLTPSQVAHRAKFCCPEHRRLNWERENGKQLQALKPDSLDK